jgi:hypothetical protein
MFTTSPFRSRLFKHYVSLSDYPCRRYPPYITAGCILLSARTARALALGARFVREFKMDDIYTALIAHLLHIQPVHNDRMLMWTPVFGWPTDEWKNVIAAHQMIV